MSAERHWLVVQPTFLIAALGILTFVQATKAERQTVWTNPAGGSFHVFTNWNYGVPGATNDALLGGNIFWPLYGERIYLESNITLRSLHVYSSLFDLDGYSITATAPREQFVPQSFAAGMSAIVNGTIFGNIVGLDNGAILSTGLVLRCNELIAGTGGISNGAIAEVKQMTLSAGRIDIANTGSVVTVTNLLHSRFRGVAELNIHHGGVLHLSGGTDLTMDTSSNKFIVIDGGRLIAESFYVEDAYGGYDTAGHEIRVSGAGSLFATRVYAQGGTGKHRHSSLVIAHGGLMVADSLQLGVDSWYHHLAITNGGRLETTSAFIASWYNDAVVSGTDSVWTNVEDIVVGSGHAGQSNVLSVCNGGKVVNRTGYLGTAANRVLVTGDGSAWINKEGLVIGSGLSLNHLTITDGGTVSARWVTLGISAPNFLTISNGILNVDGGPSPGFLDVNGGALMMSGGLVTTDRLIVTNETHSSFAFASGALVTEETEVRNGSVFQVGNGSEPATLTLLDGQHSFADGLLISSNASLNASGTVTGGVTVVGTLQRGSGGSLTVASLVLSESAAVNFELGSPIESVPRVSATGRLVMAGTINVSSAVGFTAGVYPLFTSGEQIVDNGVQLRTMPPGFSYSLDISVEGHIRLIVAEPDHVPPPVVRAVRVANNGITVSLRSFTGRTYALEYTDSLNLQDWDLLETFTGNGGSVVIADPAPAPVQRFYRVILR